MPFISGMSDDLSTYSCVTMSRNAILPLFMYLPIIQSCCRRDMPTCTCKDTIIFFIIQIFIVMLSYIYDYLTKVNADIVVYKKGGINGIGGLQVCSNANVITWHI